MCCFVDSVHLMEQMKMCGTFWFVFLFHMLLLVSGPWAELKPNLGLKRGRSGGVSAKLQAF